MFDHYGIHAAQLHNEILTKLAGDTASEHVAELRELAKLLSDTADRWDQS
jgi:hypothetical protein